MRESTAPLDDRAGASDLERASDAYRAFEEAVEGQGFNDWLDLRSADSESFRVLQDVRKADPQKADRLALAMTSMPRVGDEFLGFRLIGELGSGAFGRVFLATQGDLADRPVALKVAPAMDDESRTLAQLQHTNIVPIYSVHRVGSIQAVCMPYFGSTTLLQVCDELGSQEMMPRSGQAILGTLQGRARAGGRSGVDPGTSGSSEEELKSPSGLAAPSRPGPSTEIRRQIERLTFVQAVLWVASRLAAGLAHAHERGIIHLDLKPANILLTDEGQPMLLDFNLANDLKVASSAAAAIGGTLPYMSPEQLEAYRGRDSAVDARSDLYSLGIILFELLTGDRPFEDHHGPAGQKLRRMIDDRMGPIPDVRVWNQEVSPAVASILRRCLDPDPSRRYQDARELLEDLECQLADLKLKHAPDPSPRERVAKWARRHPTLSSTTTLLIMAIGLVGLLIGGGLLMARELERAEARLRHDDFRKTFDQCHFLLNTTGGPAGHLDLGLKLASEALAAYGLDRPDPALIPAAVRSLTRDEARAVREELSELIQLMARAAIRRADQGPSKADRARILAEEAAWLALAERLDPQPSAALFEDRARLLDELGQPIEAEAARAQAAKIRPSSARDFYLLGVADLATGRYDRAERALRRSIELDGKRFWAWFALGTAHYDQGRYDAAAGEFDFCSILVPDFPWPRLNKGMSLARAGRLLEARIAFDRAIELAPDFVEALVDRALTSLELNDPASAVRDLDRAVALGARTPSILATRASALARKGDRAEAEKAFGQAIALGPDDPLPVVARGFARLDYDKPGAGADFDRALKLQPAHARALLGQALLARHEDPAGALGLANKALAADPELWDALELRALLRARLGDLDAEGDVNTLLLVPTPHRLYNAACAIAQLSKAKADPRLIDRAIKLLKRALDAGFSPKFLRDDPDLAPLRDVPAFKDLLVTPPAHPAVTGDSP